jgi:acetate kinase
MKVLVLNAGSSSQKSCLYQLPEDQLPEHPPDPLWEATIDWLQDAGKGHLLVQANAVKKRIQLESDDRQSGIREMLATLVQADTQVLDSLTEIDVVGHRVVHGGADYSQPTRITSEVKATIKSLFPLAPEHNPAHLEGIEAVERELGDVPQIAVFDTAYHRHMPPEAEVYPIPYQWFEQGIRRYGFHGTSHQYCARRAAQLLGQPLDSLKMITCHLGNGCSLAAIRGGFSIDTTMGFTPLEGLMMGSRSGTIDPAILIYLMREHHFTAQSLNNMLNTEAGLKGISGVSGDMRTILQEISQGNERAQLAFEAYIHRLRSHIGAMLATLGGLDVLVFAAGVGENACQVRKRACEGFEFLGLKLDQEQNASHPVDQDVAAADSTVRVFVIHTKEDWAIAQDCWHSLRCQPQ